MSSDLFFRKLTKDIKSIKFGSAFLTIIGTGILFALGQLVGVTLFFAVMAVFGYDRDQISGLLTDSPFTQFLAIFFIEIITVGLIYLVLRYRKQNFFKTLGLNKKPSLKIVGITLLTYGLYFLVFLAVAMIGDALVPSLNVDQQQQLGFSNVQGIGLVFVFLSLVVLPAVAEEIVFRGFLYKNLKTMMPLKVAAITTSLIFAAAHLEFFSGNPLNFIAAVDTFILSLFLIGLLEKTDNLWASIMLHAMKNSIAFVVLFVI